MIYRQSPTQRLALEARSTVAARLCDTKTSVFICVALVACGIGLRAFGWNHCHFIVCPRPDADQGR